MPHSRAWKTAARRLLAAACYPLVILAAAAFGPSFGRLPQTLGMGPMPTPVAHTIIVTILYLPPLLVLCRAVAQTIRTSPDRPRHLASRQHQPEYAVRTAGPCDRGRADPDPAPAPANPEILAVQWPV
jgi:fructoselysine-6-P-deglycase FrlB-like protein